MNTVPLSPAVWGWKSSNKIGNGSVQSQPITWCSMWSSKIDVSYFFNLSFKYEPWWALTGPRTLQNFYWGFLLRQSHLLSQLHFSQIYVSSSFWAYTIAYSLSLLGHVISTSKPIHQKLNSCLCLFFPHHKKRNLWATSSVAQQIHQYLLIAHTSNLDIILYPIFSTPIVNQSSFLVDSTY